MAVRVLTQKNAAGVLKTPQAPEYFLIVVARSSWQEPPVSLCLLPPLLWKINFCKAMNVSFRPGCDRALSYLQNLCHWQWKMPLSPKVLQPCYAAMYRVIYLASSPNHMCICPIARHLNLVNMFIYLWLLHWCSITRGNVCLNESSNSKRWFVPATQTDRWKNQCHFHICLPNICLGTKRRRKGEKTVSSALQ